jgi:hypothetical protein
MRIPDLTLPSGGTVVFRDDTVLTGREYRAFTALASRSLDAGVQTNMYVIHAAALLIESWDIPQYPGLPLPSLDKDGNADPGGMPGLNWRDVQAIDQALLPFVAEVIYQRPRVQADVDPKA